MKIAFFYEGLRPGGVEHMIANLSHALIARGHELTLILAGAPGPNDYPVAPGVTIHWLRHPANSARGTIPALARLLRAGRYDIVLSAMPQFNNAAVIARLLSGTRARNVLTERTNPQADHARLAGWKQKAWHKAAIFTYRRADAIVAVSHGLADSLARFARLERERIDVIYNPAHRPPVDGATAAHPWTRDGAGPVIVAAGRLVEQKDFATLLRALALSGQRGLRAVIFGDGPLRAELEALAATLGVAGRVALPGFVLDITPSIAAAGFFVLSSAWEGFGNVLVEALGAGASIVTTDCPDGPREIVAGGRFGALVPVGDVAAMAQAIDAMLRAPAPRDRQIARARDFSVETACDRYEAVFRRVLDA
ncbi:glycosyltransferase [Sphingomonas sp. NFR15]|uniref:glycosyltransferase n=1 Tax=Sphingomonas sp. NFR15 TaxID=1566282 RepID=UPI00088BAEE4|nr:glycosyltransferase [Sphingomonas sp. NFR15]SDA32283.1 Glycosyltransferase involved in cell wall bisynthesis [Sphingomonas sp. NFR15]